MSKFHENYNLSSLDNYDNIVENFKKLKPNNIVKIRFKDTEIYKDFFVIITTKKKLILRHNGVTIERFNFNYNDDYTVQLDKISDIEFVKNEDKSEVLPNLSLTSEAPIEVVTTKDITSTEPIEEIELNIDYNVWEQILPRDDKINFIKELLLIFYDNKSNMTLTDILNETSIFMDLIENISGDSDTSVNDSNYKPYLHKLITNRFNETNISPIVIDKKKIYDNSKDDFDPSENPWINRYTFLEYFNKDSPFEVLGSGNQDKYVTNQLFVEYLLQNKLDLNDRNNSGYTYNDYINDLYLGGETNYNDGTRDYTVSFKPIQLTHFPDTLNFHYYNITIPNSTIIYSISDHINKYVDYNSFLRKNDTDNTGLKIKSDDVDIEKSIYPNRYSVEAVYTLSDIPDESSVSKRKIKYCTGTNKVGDGFYYSNNKLDKKIWLKSQSLPPIRKYKYDGEALNVCGFFIRSPYSISKSLSYNNAIYDLDTNSKLYPKIFSSLGINNHNQYTSTNQVIILDDYTHFSYQNYNPQKDYYILIKKNKKLLTESEYKKIIEYLTPSIYDILTIEKDNLKNMDDLIEVDNMLNLYGLGINDLTANTYSIINTYLSDSIKQANIKQKRVKLKMIDHKNLNNIFSQIYQSINEIRIEDFNTMNYQTKINHLKTEITKIMDQSHQINVVNKDLTSIELFCELFAKNYLNIKFSMNTSIDMIFTYISEYCVKNLKFNQKSLESALDTSYAYIGDEKSNVLIEMLILIIDPDDIQLSIDELYLQKKIDKSILDEIVQFVDITDNLNVFDNQYSHIKNINTEVGKIDSEITRYESHYKQYLSRLKLSQFHCKNIVISKIYKNLSDLNHDNSTRQTIKKDIYKDKEFDNSINLLIIYNNLLKKYGIDKYQNIDDESIKKQFDTELSSNIENYFYYCSDFEIQNMFEHLQNMITNTSNHDQIISLLDSTDNNEQIYLKLEAIDNNLYKELIYPNDYCLVEINKTESDLYVRINKTWVKVKKENIETHHHNSIYDQFENLLHLDFDLLIKLVKNTPFNPCIPEKANHVVIDQYKLPIRFYRFIYQHRELTKRKKILKKLKKIRQQKYDELDTSYQNLINCLTDNIALFEPKKSVQKTVEKKPNIVLPSKNIINEYQKIFEIEDFDLRIDSLYKFIEKEGSYYSKKIADLDEKSPEAQSETSKWIYYNSRTIDTPICCKHYLHYKNIIFKDNVTRERELDKLITNWGGTVEGSYITCKNCGEILNPIKTSEFEGFGSNNKGLRFREEVVDYNDEDIDYNEDTAFIIFQFLSRLTKVVLRKKDLEFCLNKISKIMNMFPDKKDILETLPSEYPKIYQSIFSKVKQSKGNDETLTSQFKTLTHEYFEYFHSKKRINEDNLRKFKSFFLKDNLNFDKLLLNTFLDSMILFNQYYTKNKAYHTVVESISIYSQVLIYSLPKYTIVGDKTERREKTGKISIIKDLYKNKEWIINYLFNKIQSNKVLFKTKKLSLSDKYIKSYFDYTDKFIIKTMNLSNFKEVIIKDIHEKIKLINNDPVMIQMINIRSQVTEEEHQNNYSWNSFLPYLNILNIKDTEIDFDSSPGVTQQDIDCYRPALNYMNLINISISKDTSEHHLSNYTINLAHYPISKNYREYFLDDDISQLNPIEMAKLVKSINMMKEYNTSVKIDSKQKLLSFSNNNFVVTEMTENILDNEYPKYLSGRQNLQEYMYFTDNINFITDLDMKKRIIMEKITSLGMIIILDDEKFQNQKRQFVEINTDILKSMIKSGKYDVNQYIKEKYNFNNDGNFLEKIYNSSDSILEIDIITGKLKTEIQTDIYEKLSNKSIESIVDTLKEYNKTFNTNSAVYKNFNNEYVSKDEAVSILMMNKNTHTNEENYKFEIINQELVKLKSTFYQIYRLINPDQELQNSDINNLIDDVHHEFHNQPDLIFNEEYLDTSLFNIFSNVNQYRTDISQKLNGLIDLRDLDDFNEKIVNMDILNNYFTEINSLVEIDLIIEDIHHENKSDESIFRNSQILASKYNTKIVLLTNILNIIISAIGKLKNDHRYYLENGEFKLHSGDNIEKVCLDNGCIGDSDKSVLLAAINKNIRQIHSIYETNNGLNESLFWDTCSDDLKQMTQIADSIILYSSTFNSENQKITMISVMIYQKLLVNMILFLLSKVCLNDYINDDYILDLFNNIHTMITLFDQTDSEIEDNLKVYRADINRKRKETFEKLSEETKSTQRLLRQFNAAAMFHQEEYEETMILLDNPTQTDEELAPLINNDMPGNDDNDEYEYS